MKRQILSLLLCSCLFSGNAMAADRSVDPCEKEGGRIENAWLMTININDATNRRGLIESQHILATGGFSVDAIFAFDFEVSPTITYVVKFDPTYWPSRATAENVKEFALRDWLEITGTEIECDGEVGPLPSIGVRN